MDSRNPYPLDARTSPGVEIYERFAPPPLILARTTGQAGDLPTGVLRVRLRTHDARILTSLALLWVPDSGLVPDLDVGSFPDFGASAIWVSERVFSERAAGMVSVQDVRGTAGSPQPWPSPGLLGSLEEGVTTADELFASLFLDATSLPAGTLLARAKLHALYRLSPEEWREVVSRAAFDRVSGPSLLTRSGAL